MAILKILWPFVWEVLLGRQTVFQAIRTNKKRLLLFVMVIGMIFTTSWSMMRLVTLGRAYVELQHQCKVPAIESPVRSGHRVDTPVAAPVVEPDASQPVSDDKAVTESDEVIKSQLLNAMRGQKKHQ